MDSKKEIADNARREAEFNKLFDAVIKKIQPFGAFYKLAMGASQLVTKNLKQQIAIDEYGHPFVLYKKKFGKFLGEVVEPAHKRIFKALAIHPKTKKERRHKWGVIIGNLLGWGSAIEHHRQKKQYKHIFNISPKELKIEYAKHLAKKNPAHKEILMDALKKDIVIDKLLNKKSLADIFNTMNT